MSTNVSQGSVATHLRYMVGYSIIDLSEIYGYASR